MRQTAEHLAIDVGVGRACQVLGVPRSSVYRHREIRQKTEQDLPKKRPTPSRAMEKQERTQVLDVLNSDRFVDAAPRQVYAQLLDEGIYLCSWRSMYRILDAHEQVCERRDQLTHPAYKKPELLAQGPNQLWSWDISKLRGAGQMDLLLPLCVDGHLQSICRRLDGGQAGGSNAGNRVDPAKLSIPGDRSRYTDPPFRSRRSDDGQKPGAFTGRPGRDQISCQTSRA